MHVIWLEWKFDETRRGNAAHFLVGFLFVRFILEIERNQVLMIFVVVVWLVIGMMVYVDWINTKSIFTIYTQTLFAMSCYALFI